MNEGMALGFMPGDQRPDSADLAELLGKFSQLSSDLDIGPERAAAMLFYATEHQLERWQELLEFLTGEVTALLTEAMEATEDGD